VRNPCQIDESAILGYASPFTQDSDRLVLGDDAVVRSGSVLYLGSTIGARFNCGHNVVIRERSSLGDGVSVWSNSVIDYGCKIGSDVKIHCNCYIAQYTIIEDKAFLAPSVSVANDLYPSLEESKQKMRGPIIRRGAQIGVNSTLLPYVEIGESSIVGSGSVVTRDVPPRSIVAGNPARVIESDYSTQRLLERLKARFSRYGEKLD